MSEPPRAPEADAADDESGDRIAWLEDRVRELEARAHAAQAEREQLVRACSDASAAQHAAEDAMRAREDILAGVAHDLRNPLGTIVMGASALRQLGGEDERALRVESIAERIHRQAERMAHQIGALSDLVELEAGRLAIQRARCAPCAIVDAAGERVGSIARERGLAFEAHAEADLPPVECDGERVVQVLSNLVTCAVKVTARGGTIEVGARAAENEGGVARGGVARGGVARGGEARGGVARGGVARGGVARGDLARGVVFFVRDTGPGKRRDATPAHAGSEWLKAHPSVRPGIGFALARGVVDAHGGHLWTVSEPNVGSTVCFSLA